MNEEIKVGELINCLLGEIDGLIIGKMTYILRENLVEIVIMDGNFSKRREK